MPWASIGRWRALPSKSGLGPPLLRKSRYGPTIAQRGGLLRELVCTYLLARALTGFNLAGAVTKCHIVIRYFHR
jgi:hypothetical protein